MEVHNNRTRMDIHNVIGILRGEDEPGERISVGDAQASSLCEQNSWKLLKKILELLI